MGNTTVYEKPENKLTSAEEGRKAQLEETISKYSEEFLEVARALAEIRGRKLYRAGHKTFDAYVKQVFDLAPRTAYQYISASEAYENLRNCAQNSEVIDLLPANEAQLRPLTRLPAPQQRVVWQMAVESAAGGKLTAKHIDRTAKQYLGEQITKSVRKARQEAAGDRQLKAGLRACFADLADQIELAREDGYKGSSRKAILAHLDQLRALIAEDGPLHNDPVVHDPDADKLELAGYRFFRLEPGTMEITERAGGARRVVHSGPFAESKKGLTALRELLKDAKHLRG